MTILVTGGAGYIGSVTSQALIDDGHEVVVIDNLATGHRRAVPAGATFVEADLHDRARVGRTLAEYGVDAVMHFAASSLVGESMRDPVAYFDNNVTGSLSLLGAMIEHGVDRFVLSSTAALFGTPERVPIPEEAPVAPGSVYGETKYQIERMLAWLRETKGLGYVALRYFNAAGAHGRHGEDHDPETHLIPLVLQVPLGRRERIAIFGDDYDTPDGTCVRDYIHVRDLASAHVLAITALEPGEARAYNLGSGRGYSVREVIDVCRQVTGHAIPTEITGRRPGDPAVLVADSQRIRRELGWQPDSDLEAMVATAWAWHRAHPHGYDD